MGTRPQHVAAGIPLLFCFGTTLAQDSVLNPVVVTASRLEQPLTDTIAHTTVIDWKQIRESQAVDLPSLLRREASFELVQNGGTGTSASIFLRGAEARQVLVLIDGVRIGSATLGTTAIEHLMLNEIERVEVVRGNVSALYGAGAIGGVIQIFTKQGRGAPHGRAQVTAGSRGTSNVSASYGGDIGDTRFHIGASRFETAGFSAIDTRVAPRANPDDDGYRNRSVSAQLAHTFRAGHEIGLRTYQSNGSTDFDSAFGAPTDVHRLDSELSSYSLYSNNRLATAWTSHLTAAQTTDRSHSYTNNLPPTRFDTRNTQLAWQNDMTIASGHVISAGVEAQQQRVDSTTAYQRTTRDVHSTRVAYNGRIRAHQLQGAARRDHYSDFGDADTWLAGYGYDLTSSWKLTAMRSTAFTAPTFNQLFFPGFGNPALQPEKTHSSEIGIQYAVENHVVRATAFRTQYRNLIQTVFVAPSVSRAENVARARVEGTELSYSGRFDDWDVRASVTVQDPVDLATGARLRRRGSTFGNVAASTTVGLWRLGGEVLNGSSRPDANIVTGAPVSLGGYTVVNFTARRPISKTTYVAARMDNAFAAHYTLAHGFNVPPRGVFVSLGWQP